MSNEPPTPPAGPVRRKRGYWIPGSIAMTVLLVMALALGAGDLDHQAPKSLDGYEVAGQVSLWLQSRLQLQGPPPVVCPASEPTRRGLQFSCTSRRGGKVTTISALEVTPQGQLQLSIVSR